MWSYLSASSNTTYSMLCSFKFISTATCTKRPGVAMILEGGGQVRSAAAPSRPFLALPSSWLSGKRPQTAVLNPNSHVGIFVQGSKLVFHPGAGGGGRGGVSLTQQLL